MMVQLPIAGMARRSLTTATVRMSMYVVSIVVFLMLVLVQTLN